MWIGNSKFRQRGRKKMYERKRTIKVETQSRYNAKAMEEQGKDISEK